MSRTINIVVLCPNGRRETVKSTQNSSILQILEEACFKQRLNPDDFDICHYNKVLDLSLPIRFANIPNNALLELQHTKRTRKESVVTVGLQLESGERIMNDFGPSATIQNIIECSLNSRLDILPLQGTEPICIYMRQKLVGDAIKNTSLRNLGLTKGKAIIRLLYRKPEEMDEQAHVAKPLLKSSTPEALQSSATEQTITKHSFLNPLINNEDVSCDTNSSLELSVEKSKSLELCERTTPLIEPKGFKFDKKQIQEKSTSHEIHAFVSNNEVKLPDVQSMEVDINHENETDLLSGDFGEIHYIGEKHAVLYSLDDISDIKKADLPDDFFELTVNDVKYLMEEYKRTRMDLENQPLITREQRQRNILQNLAHYRQVVIRVYFPEKLVLQAVFKSTETVQDVCDFVKNFLEEKDLSFFLYVTPPKQKLNPSCSLLESLLVPAAVVYFGSEIYRPNYLMRKLKEKISDPRAASLAAAESRKYSFSHEPLELPFQTTENVLITDNQDNVVPLAVLDSTREQPTHSRGNIPKWLKLSKK